MKNVVVMKNGETGWQVKMDDKEVYVFSTRDEAQAFAERLQARINALHDLPAEAGAGQSA